MTNPFAYPSRAHIRRHGPIGYAEHESYRPWLRDEFSFRCVYCLLREKWGQLRGIYHIDHFVPIALDIRSSLKYDNLLYACATCNGVKGKRLLPNPMVALTSENVFVDDFGVLHATSADAAWLIDRVGLNSDKTVEFRFLWNGIIAMASKYNPGLFYELMGFPKDLPNLGRLRPPAGNSRPSGIDNSFFALRKRGLLPETY